MWPGEEDPAGWEGEMHDDCKYFFSWELYFFGVRILFCAKECRMCFYGDITGLGWWCSFGSRIPVRRFSFILCSLSPGWAIADGREEVVWWMARSGLVPRKTGWSCKILWIPALSPQLGDLNTVSLSLFFLFTSLIVLVMRLCNVAEWSIKHSSLKSPLLSGADDNIPSW